MASLAPSTSSAAAIRELGATLTGTEANQIARRLADGDTLTAALRTVNPARRAEIRTLLTQAGLETPERLIPVLLGIEGAHSRQKSVRALWTMPGHLAESAPLTSSIRHLVDSARVSITCSTFNFQRTSALWSALREASARPDLTVRVYLDTRAVDNAGHGTPTSVEIAQALHPAVIMRTKSFDGQLVRNHAKFLAIDHRFLLVTSANLSWSAEHANVELGVLIDDIALTEAVERETFSAIDSLYEQVAPKSIPDREQR